MVNKIIMNVKFINMKSSILFVLLLTFISCKKSKEDQNKELIEYFSKKNGWSSAMSRPINHPIEAPQIEYFYKGKPVNNTGTTTDIGNSGWANSSQGRNSGYGTAYPDSVYVSYGGLNNKLEMCTYEGGAKLPAKVIEKLFKNGYLYRDKKEKYTEIITGMAPGGRICVWVDHIEVARFIVKEKDKYNNTPVIIFGDENEILSYLKKHPIDYSTWERPDSRYDLDYGFCSEDEKNTFFHGFVITKEGATYPVYEGYIDYTIWNKPFGEKPNLMEYCGYQQIGNIEKDYKMNLPNEINLIWKKDGTKFYNTNIIMPKSLPQRFTKSYINPLSGKKSNYNRIVFGVEKDGEHCVVWLDGPNKQEKIMRFKGQIAKIDKKNDFVDIAYATEVVFY